MTKVLIETYGCTLNQADSDIMARLLDDNGIETEHGRFGKESECDVVVLNTCTVKKPTEQKILHRLSEISSSGTKVIVSGCMASANPDMIRKAAPGSGLVNTSNIGRIADAVIEIESGARPSYQKFERIDKSAYYGRPGGTIARIPLSEGCLSSCNFCETKFARGPLNSFSEKLILKAIRMSVENGAREIELTAQDVGAYGLDRKTNIAELLQQADEVEGEFRIRVGMLNPGHLDKYFDKLITALKSNKVYKFLHLPVQSGSNNVLRSMKRDYTIEQYNAYVSELRQKIGDISIATDIIVGYPGESGEDFSRTVGFIKETRPTVTNMSRFYKRPHAEASRLAQIDSREMKRRIAEVSRVARAVQRDDLSRLVGSRSRILVTERNERSFTGRDDSYRTVALTSDKVDLGQFVEAEIYANSSVCLFATA